MKHLLLIILLLLALTCYGQCTYTNPSPFPNPLVIKNGEILCITTSMNVATALTIKSGGELKIYNNSIFRVTGSMAVQGTGLVNIEDCGSKLHIWGAYSGFPGKCEIHYFCDECDLATSTPYVLLAGAEAWREWCCEEGLPVELISFKVINKDCIDYLSWSTASEINNDFFVVEHSVNGTEWESLDTLQGKGTSFTLTSYNYKIGINSEVNYYRLKQVDFDKTSVYSNIIISNCILKKPRLLKTINILGQEIGPDTRGLVVEIYDDGTVIKLLR